MPEGQPHRHSPPAVMKELQIEPVMIVSTWLAKIKKSNRTNYWQGYRNSCILLGDFLYLPAPAEGEKR
jgi:hypothetical protein